MRVKAKTHQNRNFRAMHRAGFLFSVIPPLALKDELC